MRGVGMRWMIDLHTHTFFSDGELGMAELVRRAEVAGYCVIGVSDHADSANLDFLVPHVCLAARELSAVYRLRTVTIPTHRPSARVRLPDRVCENEAQKWQAVADLVAQLHAHGQPVLVGTRSVEASDRLSRVLASKGLEHQLLNARQDADEAAVVSQAGQAGAITVATNMAGRGTDIVLGPGIAQRGGLCVVLTEYHESPRIDRQLFGRCARQGDPGTCVAIVALDDSLFKQHGGVELKLLQQARRLQGADLQAWVARCRRNAQSRAEAMHARTRRDTLARDHNLDKLMAFSGDPL